MEFVGLCYRGNYLFPLFKHPTVQSPNFQVHSHIELLPTVLTEKSCVKWSGCCTSVFTKAWPDMCCGPEQWAKTNSWVEQRKRCCSVCPEHHAGRVSPLREGPLGPTSPGLTPGQKRKREKGANNGKLKWEGISNKSKPLWGPFSNCPYL